MNYLWMVGFIVCCTFPGFSQKPPLDISVMGKFPMLGYFPAISNDGRFVTYTINFQPAGSQTLIVQKIEGTWRKEFVGADCVGFSSDSKQFIFTRTDTLWFWPLGREQGEYVADITSCKLPNNSNHKWLAYQLKGKDKMLVLRNLFTGKEQPFKYVKDYAFNEKGNALLLQSGGQADEDNIVSVQWVDLWEGTTRIILDAKELSGKTVGGYRFGAEGTQLALLLQENTTSGRPRNTVWYYRSGMNKALLKVDCALQGVESGLVIGGVIPYFSENGQYIFFKLEALSDSRKPGVNAIKVNVWSYNDSILQSAQVNDLFGPITETDTYFAAAVAVEGKRVLRLEQRDEHAFVPGKGDIIILNNRKTIRDYWWPSYPDKMNMVLSLKDSSLTRIPLGVCFLDLYWFSPKERYFVYYDPEKQQYFSYEVSTNRRRNISEAISISFAGGYQRTGLRHFLLYPEGVAGWLADESGILVYDNYDIWRLDPSGGSPPVNITNGYGRRHHIKFRILDTERAARGFSNEATLLLSAFNTENKHNGFYRKKLVANGNPELLSMGPYTMCHLGLVPGGESAENLGMEPVKALEADCWLVMRQAAGEAPNLYYTRNFKEYVALTNLQPEKDYNWLTTDLVTWEQFDGTMSQGVLYRPENFDPELKYPLILYYYEKRSHMLFDYLFPDFSGDGFNISLYVSNGYLVFTPDIHYKVGAPGISAYNSVASAARHLSKLSYVDSARMGIVGYSFGGYETNYLLTHTDFFAAAVEGAGSGNLISHYGNLEGKPGSENYSSQSRLEVMQYSMGCTPWECPDLYIKNSPIFSADKVMTPLLMVHNKMDPIVPWSQGIELFTALRRLQKKVWMLDYDNSNHGVFGKDAVDLTVRVMQFFNHYLYGYPPPRWMMEGIRTADKGIIGGLELDTSGHVP